MFLLNSARLMNRRLLAVLLLGFSSGLPLVLVGSTLQAWFTEANVDLVTVGAVTLLGIPYTLKFLWAPLLDQYGFSRWGKRRGWVFVTQFMLAVLLFLLAQMNPELGEAKLMGVIALIIAFFSATQDIAIDAYRTDILKVDERGLGSAYYIFAYRCALLIAGGLALIFADYLGWKFTYECMGFLMLASMVATYQAPDAPDNTQELPSILNRMTVALSNLIHRKHIALILLFVVFYKFGDALALSLMTNFLLHGLGFTLTQIGVAYKLVSFIATVLGAFVGGVILMRWNIYRALLVFGLAQAFSNLMFAWLAAVGHNFLLMAASIFVENFCSGLSTAAFMAWMMSLCDHRYTAAQYALLSAVASLGRVFLGPVAGLMVEHVGWIQFYIWSFVLSFPGIIWLLLLKDRVFPNAQITAK